MMITLEKEPTFDRIWSLTFSLLLELGISKPQLRDFLAVNGNDIHGVTNIFIIN